MEKRIVLNLDYCIGCRSCAAACNYRYHFHPNLAHGEIGEKANLPLHCRHCEQPTCTEVCPTEALKKGEDGIVRRRSFLCIGCRSCVIACPFGVITPDLKYKITQKCDLCSDRVAKGKEPRCVVACPSGALSYEELEEIVTEEEHPQMGARVQARPRPIRRG